MCLLPWPLPLGCQAPCERRIALRSDFSSPVAPGGGSVAFWLLWAAWDASSPPDDPALGLGGCPGAERGLRKLVDVPQDALCHLRPKILQKAALQAFSPLLAGPHPPTEG